MNTQDQLSAARGILLALAVSSLLWIIFFAAVFYPVTPQIQDEADETITQSRLEE